ncbi:hypothetical protein M422DRAFT_776742 [Sphaerobolus stellatus SS14]|nr:hypothetical protein M422DRAFT_776742 [Sphaerobolus stellatus SS14]
MAGLASTNHAATHQTRKSYAQVIKDRAKPRPRPAVTLEISANNKIEEDGWTDISSVSSCNWPKSPTAFSDWESVHSGCEFWTESYTYQLDMEAGLIGPELWEQKIDTRASQVLAGRIKHKEKLNWRYQNLSVTDRIFLRVEEDPISRKPWKEYPGRSHRRGYLENLGEEKLRRRMKRDLQSDTKIGETDTIRLHRGKGKGR